MEDFKVWMVLGMIGTFLLMLLPIIRDIVAAFFRALGPVFVGLGKWLLFIAKHICAAHVLLIKNLVTPHSQIYKTLDDKDEAN